MGQQIANTKRQERAWQIHYRNYFVKRAFRQGTRSAALYCHANIQGSGKTETDRCQRDDHSPSTTKRDWPGKVAAGVIV
jgi:hypothetical protein